jgi:hypothetical protein
MNPPIEKIIDKKTKSTKVVYPLEYPITINENGKETQIYQVEVGRLKVKHLRILPASFFAKEDTESMTPEEVRMVVIALTNLTADQADEIDMVECFGIVAIGKELLK